MPQAPIDPEVMQPTGSAYPMHHPQPAQVRPFGLPPIAVGVIGGVALTLAIMWFVKEMGKKN